MTIREFNERCQIGSTVFKNRKALKIIDINRRNHTAIFHNTGWVRCSEFFLTREEDNRHIRGTDAKRGRGVVKVINGKILEEYVSVTDAARKNGYRYRNSVDWQCRASKSPSKTYYYRDDPKIEHLLR